MNTIPLKYQIGGNKKSIYKSGDNLTSEEIRQIKAVYQNSNCQNQSITWRSNMDTNNWEFQLILVDDKIVCVGGVKLDTKELGHDCTHIDYTGKGLYKDMCNERIKNIKNFHNGKTFYLFTEWEYLINTHLNSGLVLLDQKSTPGTFTCRYTNQKYSAMTDNYYIFRTVTPSSYKMNLVSYNHTYGNCSGMYIGNGNIITAGHCYKEKFNEIRMNINEITFGWQTANKTLNISHNLNGSIYKYNNERDINNQWKDISIIKLPQILLNKIKDLQLETIPILINPEKTPPTSSTDASKLKKLTLFGRTADSLEREVEINKNMFIEDNSDTNFLKHLTLNRETALTLNAFDIKLENSNIITEYKKRFTCLTQRTKSMGGDSGGPLFFFEENKNIPIYIGDLLGLSSDLCDSKTTTNTNPRFGYGPVVINSAYFINWIEQYSDKLFIYDYVTKNISIYENPLKRIIINCNQ